LENEKGRGRGEAEAVDSFRRRLSLFFYPHGNVAEISASRLRTLAILNASLKKLTILLTMGRMARKHGSIYIGKKGVD